MAKARSAWPEAVTSDPEFERQIEERMTLRQQLDDIMSRLPRADMDISQAIEQGLISKEEVAALYESLDLLLQNPDYERAALYIPFELLPDSRSDIKSDSLKQASDKFRKTYTLAWSHLLGTHDVRANFVDGDVMDVETRTKDLDRVVKAAHLAPILVAKGIISAEDILGLTKHTDDEVLRKSLADALLVMTDMKLVGTDDLSEPHIAYDSAEAKPDLEQMSFDDVQSALHDKMSEIDAEEFANITEKRKNWLRTDKKRKAVEEMADKISRSFMADAMTAEDLEALIQADDLSITQTGAESIRQIIETVAKTDQEKAKKIFGHFRKTLFDLWPDSTGEMRDSLGRTFYHLYHLQIIDESDMEKLELRMPKFTGELSENLDQAKNLPDTKKIILAIEDDPDLSRLVYSVVLKFGSRLKGYGSDHADLDLAIFVRPDVKPEEKQKIRQSLGQIFESLGIKDDVIEFWLVKADDNLEVNDSEDKDTRLGHSSWTHVLFGAEWDGDAASVNEMKSRLLAPYLYETKKIIHGRDARGLYLEEMERDAILYRLAQKGYDKFFPRIKGMESEHSSAIDGQSAFWDSGFRKMALKIYAERVFLPKLKK